MGPSIPGSIGAVVALLLVLAVEGSSLPPSQVHSVLRLQRLLGYPSALAHIDSNATQGLDLCGIPPSPVFNLSCNSSAGSFSSTIVSIQILGNATSLSRDFSMETLGNLLSALPELEILGLVHLGLWGSIPPKLDHLQSLRVLDLSENSISGALPDRLRALSRLEILQLKDNRLNGTLPGWIGELRSLRELDLSNNAITGKLPKSLFSSRRNRLERLVVSHNDFSGNLPDWSSDSLLVYFNAGANHIGPAFPKFGYGGLLQSLLLGQNDITGGIPRDAAARLGGVRTMDLSYNELHGMPPAALFRLGHIETLALNGNQFLGVLPYNLSLSPSLALLDLSSNFFTGRVPASFLGSGGSVVVRFGKNCFATRVQQQYTRSHCDAAARKRAAASAAGASTPDSHDLAIIAGIVGGGIALVGAVAVFLCVLLRCLRQQKDDKPVQYAASSCADTASIGVPSDLLSNARYLSQSIRLGVHSTSHNRVFSVPELEEATANFSLENLIGEGQHGKVFKGKLHDGTVAAVKCLTLDSRQDMRQLKIHVELLVKIRHRHLVGYIGYSLDNVIDGATQCRKLYLVSEYIDNGTLRNHLSKAEGREVLSWSQRLAAAIGAGRGIQYLHTGVVPGIFNNDVNITNVLMDQNCVAKFTDFGLFCFQCKTSSSVLLFRKLASDKTDVYNFGFILLEILLGKPPTIEDSKSSVHPKEMLQTEHVPRYEVVDPAIIGNCVAESLTTVLEIAAKCLSEEPSSRPSMEDVLWNLQYAAQVQDRVSGECSEELPYVSPPRSRFNRQAIRTSGITNRKNESGPEFLR
ncbi:hypothetical protein SELMODRAFT_115037 [Selaginella moellendorffii]|uniref:Protein kinase domain-containing protein n=1 Tax=Selaginella moellendorffii TaxID=88036 RepID=D8SEH1_SELML|nr:hypothetical protein SELMODRAFT_115037 [Selaginella moellendorffii]